MRCKSWRRAASRPRSRSMTAAAAAALAGETGKPPVMVLDTGANVVTYLNALQKLAAGSEPASITIYDGGGGSGAGGRDRQAAGHGAGHRRERRHLSECAANAGGGQRAGLDHA